MTNHAIKGSYSVCGLVCALCSGKNDCPGCRHKEGGCEIKNCCVSKGHDYCFECEKWPCGKDMHKSIRTRAFNRVAKNEGLDRLAEYLLDNFNRGIYYHGEHNITGDYDRCRTEDEVISLLKNGRPDPYDQCPEYESEHFLLRLVSLNDAEDLLECYKTPSPSVIANGEYCGYGYGAQTVEEMHEYISKWLEEYHNRSFARFSILDKKSGKAVGTIEIFASGLNGHSVLRMDLLTLYENQANADELLKISDSFFHDFGCDKIVTKEGSRACSLIRNGYEPYPVNEIWERYNYYVKTAPGLKNASTDRGGL